MDNVGRGKEEGPHLNFVSEIHTTGGYRPRRAVDAVIREVRIDWYAFAFAVYLERRSVFRCGGAAGSVWLCLVVCFAPNVNVYHSLLRHLLLVLLKIVLA